MLAELETDIADLVGHKAVDAVDPVEAVLVAVDETVCGLLHLFRHPHPRRHVTAVPVREIAPLGVVRVHQIRAHQEGRGGGNVFGDGRKVAPLPAQGDFAVGPLLDDRHALQVHQLPSRNRSLRTDQLDFHQRHRDRPAQGHQPTVVGTGLVGLFGLREHVGNLDEVAVLDFGEPEHPQPGVVVEAELGLRQAGRVALAGGHLGPVATEDPGVQDAQSFGLRHERQGVDKKIAGAVRRRDQERLLNPFLGQIGGQEADLAVIEQGDGGFSSRGACRHFPQLALRSQPVEAFRPLPEKLEQPLRAPVLGAESEHRVGKFDRSLVVTALVLETREFHHQIDVRR